MSVNKLQREHRYSRRLRNGICFTAFGFALVSLVNHAPDNLTQFKSQAAFTTEDWNKCQGLNTPVGPVSTFAEREESDRFEPGTKDTLITNATLWLEDGAKPGDIFLEKGIIKDIGNISDVMDNKRGLNIVDAKGAWITPGLIDMDSRAGVFSIPFMRGSDDVGSDQDSIAPWLNSLDALDTHDAAFYMAVAGGVTSAQIIPGDKNIIGGQALLVKYRRTRKGTSSSMVVEPPWNSTSGSNAPWRHLVQSCAKRDGGTRMDTFWRLRNAYHRAAEIKFAQDAYCAKVQSGVRMSDKESYPDDFGYEALIDVLRGRVKVTSFCSEVVDLESMIRLSNEFKFPIASFQNADEAWMSPAMLNQSWPGHPPVVALFSTRHRTRRESLRGSEYAPRILNDKRIKVALKTGHPAINARYLINEAQTAYHYGLSPEEALASITSVPAKALGMDHRLGRLEVGKDADVVMWDSHPLQIGARPQRVWIDGLQVLFDGGQDEPRNQTHTPLSEVRWDEEIMQSIAWDGLPPLSGAKDDGSITFKNVSSLWTRKGGKVTEDGRLSPEADSPGVVVARKGKITCVGQCSEEGSVINLRGGSISPGFMAVGSLLGMEEIEEEPTTGDGKPFDPFSSVVPAILKDVGGITRGLDALQFGTRNAMLAYRNGVTYAASYAGRSLSGKSVIQGVSVAFHTGADHGLVRGSVIQDAVALHIALERSFNEPRPSISSSIAALRRLLLARESTDTETGSWFKQAATGVVPLVVDVNSVDIMATLIRLKLEVEEMRGSTMRMVFSGGAEAYLIAEDLARVGVGIILCPIKPSPTVWDERRMLYGPPVTNTTAVAELLRHGVAVGFGVADAWAVSNLRFDIGWNVAQSPRDINYGMAYTMGSVAVEKLLGVRNVEDEDADLVAYQGGHAFELCSKAVAILSSHLGYTETF